MRLSTRATAGLLALAAAAAFGLAFLVGQASGGGDSDAAAEGLPALEAASDAPEVTALGEPAALPKLREKPAPESAAEAEPAPAEPAPAEPAPAEPAPAEPAPAEPAPAEPAPSTGGGTIIEG